jgi:hypothetical protein
MVIKHASSLKILLIIHKSPIRKNVSLRGGTTKQSVRFSRMPFVKFIAIAQLMCFIRIV